MSDIHLQVFARCKKIDSDYVRKETPPDRFAPTVQYIARNNILGGKEEYKCKIFILDAFLQAHKNK